MDHTVFGQLVVKTEEFTILATLFASYFHFLNFMQRSSPTFRTIKSNKPLIIIEET